MKRLFFALVGLLISGSAVSQHILQDEALQARVHYMNTAKVSYVASADMYQADFKQNQDPEIPKEIINSFKDRYQGAKKVEWTLKEDRYKISFQLKGYEMFTYLDRHGLWMKSFTKLDLNELPESVISHLDSEYPDYQLTKFYLKDTPEGHSYTVAVKGNEEYVWLEFDENGQLLNSPAS